MDADIDAIRSLGERVRAQVTRVVVGQDAALDALLTALIAEGHVLLEGMPGTAKTLLARAFARSLDPARAADHAQERAHLGLALVARDDAARQLPGLTVLRGRVDHGQRGHALSEVASDLLAQVVLLPDEVEHVVGDLERQPHVRAERPERGDVPGVRVGQQGGALAAGRVQRRGLELDPLEILGLAGHALRRGHLGQLAVAEREHRLRDHGDDLGLGQHGGQGVRLGEQVVADDESHVVVPDGVHGGHVPPDVGAVDDVVVDQGRRVHELERLGQVHDHPRPGSRPETRRQEHQRGPQELAGRAEQVRRGGGEGGVRAPADIAEPLPQLIELGLDRRVEGRRAPRGAHAVRLAPEG